MRILFTIALLLPALASGASAQVPVPTVNDPRLKIELFADAPDIVTPIGIDVDDKGRVYVIESHTHFPPNNYKGPNTDRIRIYEDTNGDRKADKITDFHTGETHTMSIALYRDGSLYVATRKEIFRLRDTDGDGKADERTTLVKLDTKGNYPHNGLCGFAFDFKGDVYFGFGENLGEPYKLIGSDGVTLAGGGEGGNMYVCDKDGKKLRRIATGFWNPFHMCFDAFGRLFAVDNDPDGRPPCRLLHIVEGGDYGYRFRYGRKGLHPFTSWNGEIPGTLPMIAGTGEAPSGMLAYESDNLPDDYLGDLLVTSWGDHRIERYRLKPNGASFTSKMEPVITGGENFRPVGIALAPDGSLYISDWVDKSYNVHGKGRIWRISAKEEKKVERPNPVKEPEKAIFSKHRTTREKAARQLSTSKSGIEVLETAASNTAADLRTRVVATQELLCQNKGGDKLAQTILLSKSPRELKAFAIKLATSIPDHFFADLSNRDDLNTYIVATLESSTDVFTVDPQMYLLGDADVFVRHAAMRAWLNNSVFKTQLLMTAYDPKKLRETYLAMLVSPELVVQSLILSQRGTGSAVYEPFLDTYLKASDPDIRFLAIQWVAEQKLTQYRKHLTDSLTRPDLTPRLLVATLTAIDMLDGGKPGSVDHVGGRWFLERLAFGDKTPAATRAMGLRMLPADNPALNAPAFRKLLEVDDAPFRIEVVRTLRQSPIKERAAMVREIVSDKSQPDQVRAEAVAGLDAEDADERKMLIALAKGDHPLLNREALRSLRGIKLDDEKLNTTIDTSGRPKGMDMEQWLGWLDVARPDSPEFNETAEQQHARRIATGQRIFFSAKAGGCYRCHTVQGRGGEAGPDLSTIGKSMTRERLFESIINPSKEIAPRYAAQLVELADGEKLTLMFVGPSPDGRDIWADAQGKHHLIAPGEIESKQPLTTSIMPAGLHQSMTRNELRDLLAFLESLK